MKNNLLDQVRERMKSKQGQSYWRSLEELADTPEFQQLVQNEFPDSPMPWDTSVDRRGFLKFMGASLALAGLGACTRQPTERIIPYVTPPEVMIPGEPLYFATAHTFGGFATGVIVESHMGRPTKIEGNPIHPASLGATDIFAQAAVLELYDPDRAQVVSRAGRISTWESFLAELNTALESQKSVSGAGIRILTETITSPTLANQLQSFLSLYPDAKWRQYEPVNRDQYKKGTELAFGEFLDIGYDFSRAEVILSLDADFLVDQPGSLKYTRDFSAKRKIDHDHSEMSRLYVVESTPTLTGTMADHRLSLAPSRFAAFVGVLAEELGVTRNLGLQLNYDSSQASAFKRGAMDSWIKAVAKDMNRHRGSSLITVGAQQAPEVQALVHAMNQALGNVGSTVTFTAPIEPNPVIQQDSLRELTDDMHAGKVELLVVLGGNPVFNAPVDLNFTQAMSEVKLRVHLSLEEDETSELCHWHIPRAHFLESWGDVRAYDGTASIVQPLIAPLYGGKSALEMVTTLLGQAGTSDYDVVRNYWQSQDTGGDFEKFWQQSVHDGVIAGTAAKPKTPKLKLSSQSLDLASSNAGGFEIIFRPDPTIWDGRFANNGWLQELPKPLTKLTWDNAVLISPATAERLSLKNQQVVELAYQGRTIEAPVWITPGHPDQSATVHFGYGRRRTGPVGSGAGFDAYALRTSGAPWSDSGLQIKPTTKTYALATTQLHSNMENRHLVRVATLEEYQAHPELIHEMGHEPADDLTFYPKFENPGYAWGMAIDLNACTGCGACTVACQSENNIAVVGKDQVSKGREMQWIRIDRYYEGSPEQPETHHQPVMCMHCENAPCEVVCPVAATTHSDEGLNEMIYNRCVGTRYCSNNCPYKVRRFNFFLYSDFETESLQLMRNPDVTVRSRGVMEKCTYCVQRINSARIDAKKEDRLIRDGEIVSACQQACPADAIVFGDINDPESRVSRMKAEHRNYGLLADVGTRPRTTYLAKIRNPNREIEQS